MTLRARVTLIVTLSFAVLVAGITYGALLREEVLAGRFTASRVQAQQAQWQQVTTREAQALGRLLPAFDAIPGLIPMIGDGDRAAVPSLVQPLAARLQADNVSLIEVLDRRGVLLYTSSVAAQVEGRSITDAGELARAAEQRIDRPAILRGIKGELLVGVIRPVFLQGAFAGSIVLGRPVGGILQEIKAETGIDVFLAELDGDLIDSTAPGLWGAVAEALPIGLNGVLDLETDDGIYGVVARTLSSAGGARLAVQVTAEDITDVHGRLDLVRQMSIGGSILFGVFLLLGLSLYMGRSFRPLQAAIDGLDALARGDMSVEVEGGRANDEVGRVAQAVRLFRDRLRLEALQSGDRDRRRRRQQRVIRQQMLSLAETLDAGAREEVLRDLDSIEKASTAGRDGAAAPPALDGLSVAFDVMVRRVREQNHRLDGVVARLREALEAKEELAGLQHQMQAAGRMQRAMLPAPVPARDDFELAGAMRQAEEFGGTFYDYILLPDGRIGMVLGEVHGDGLPAAFRTQTAGSLLRAAILITDPPEPDRVLRMVNNHLHADTSGAMAVSAFVGIIDPATARMTYAVAGGQPAYLLRRLGDVAVLPAPGNAPPLAQERGVAYVARSIDVPVHATLVVCSTGVGSTSGGARGLLAEAQDLSPEGLTDYVTAAERDGALANKDATSVALRILRGDLEGA